MEPIEILMSLETSKERLDKLTRELATVSKERCELERKCNKENEIQIEKARAEKIQATLIKEVAKSRMADLLFELRILEVKETYFLNLLRNERSQNEILRTMLSYKKEEMKDL